MYWELIRQKKHAQINKDYIHKNSRRADHDYQVENKDYKAVDKVMLANNNDFKYETLQKGPFGIMQCWNNGTFTLKYGAIKNRYNIHIMKPYTSDTTLNISNVKICMKIVNI